MLEDAECEVPSSLLVALKKSFSIKLLKCQICPGVRRDKTKSWAVLAGNEKFLFLFV